MDDRRVEEMRKEEESTTRKGNGGFSSWVLGANPC